MEFFIMSHNQSKLQVAIVQHRFIKGGRLHVLIDITRVLNKLGIIPDFISFDFEFTIEDIHKSYGNEVQLQLRQIRGMHYPKISLYCYFTSC